MSKEKFYTTLNCNIHKIASETTDEATKQQLLTLWKNSSMYSGAKEAINCSYLHTQETINEAKTEISCLSSAENLHTEIISRK